MTRILIPRLVGAALLCTAAPAVPQDASRWTIGPIDDGVSYSPGMPLRPQSTREGWAFDFPGPRRSDGHVHYVTMRPGSLENKRRIVVRYRVEAARGARFVPQEQPDKPATVSLYFQRAGDTWTGKRQYAFYRWFAPAHTVQQIRPGVHEMVVEFDDPKWVSVMGGKNPGANPRGYRDARRHVDNIGLVFGSSGMRGHGVFATRPARFELLDFRIE